MANDLNIVYKIAADITGLQSGVNRAASATERLVSTANKVAAAFGVAFSAQALIGFGKTVIAAGDNFQKMADQTGLSIKAVQQLNYIADQSSVSIGSLIGAVQNLQQRLGDDNSGAAAAIKKLGINLEELNRLDTYQQMVTLAGAIKNIHDPTEQASAAAAIFGKTWKEILPAIKSGMEDVGNAAPVMSDKTVQSLAKMDDALKEAQAQGLTLAGTLVGALADFDKAVLTSRERVLNLWSGGMRQVIKDAEDLRAELEKLAKTVPGHTKDLPAPLPSIVVPVADVVPAIKQVTKATDEATLAQERWLTSVEDATVAADLSIFTLHTFGTQTLPEVSSAFAEVRAETEDWIQPLEDATGAVEELQRQGRFAAATLVQLKDALITLPDVHSSLEGLADIPDEAKAAGDGIDGLARAFAQLAQVSGAEFGGIVQDFGQLVNAINVAQQAFKSMGSSATSDLAEIAAGVSSVVGVFLAFYKIAQLVGQSGVAQLAREAQRQTGVDDLLKRYEDLRDRGVLTQDPAAVAEFQKLWDLLAQPGTPENLKAVADQLDRVNAILDSMDAAHIAGFLSRDDLVAAAQKAHDVYDAVVRGVQTGQYTIEQALEAELRFQTAIAAIPGAAGEAAREWLKAHGAITDAATAATKVLDGLKAKRASLAEAISHEAPEAVMGVIETQMRGELAALDNEIAAQQKQTEEAATTAAGVINDMIGGAAEDVRDKLGVEIEDGLGTAGPAAETARAEIEGAFAGLSFDIPYRFYQEGAGIPSLPVVPMAKGGDFWVTKPTLFMAGEDGPERATFSPAGSSSGGSVIQNTILLDGLVVHQSLVRYVKGNKRGLGTQLNDALAGVP